MDMTIIGFFFPFRIVDPPAPFLGWRDFEIVPPEASKKGLLLLC